MEGENKSKQIKLSSLLLFLAVLIILAMGGFIAKLLIDKSSADKKTDELNTQVNKLEESVEELKHSLNDSSDTNNSKPVSANDDKSEKSDNKYTQITGELDGIDVLYVTDVVKEGNNYTLKGVIYTQYTMSAKEVQKVYSYKDK